MKGARYRLKIVIDELEAPNPTIEYQVALLSFVNCLINATQGLRERIRLRNEFIGKFRTVLGNNAIEYIYFSQQNFFHNRKATCFLETEISKRFKSMRCYEIVKEIACKFYQNIPFL